MLAALCCLARLSAGYHLTEEDFLRGERLNDADLVAGRVNAGGPLRSKINVTVDQSQRAVSLKCFENCVYGFTGTQRNLV